MSAGKYPRLLVIDSKAKNTRGIPLNQVANADVIIGKGRVVLKDMMDREGEKLTPRQVDALRESAIEVIER